MGMTYLEHTKMQVEAILDALDHIRSVRATAVREVELAEGCMHTITRNTMIAESMLGAEQHMVSVVLTEALKRFSGEVFAEHEKVREVFRQVRSANPALKPTDPSKAVP